jgi:hypothetical protein
MHMGRLPLDYARCSDGEQCPYKDVCCRWLTHAFDISPAERYSSGAFFSAIKKLPDGTVECDHRILVG